MQIKGQLEEHGIKKGYKIFSVINNKYYSLFWDCPWAVKYEKDEWNYRKPNFGPMALFDDYKTAKYICSLHDNVDNIRYIIEKIFYIPSNEDSLYFDMEDRYKYTFLIVGTILADAVFVGEIK